MVPGFRRLRVVLKLLLQHSSRRWSRGFRLAVPPRVRLPLPAFTLKDPLVAGEVSFLSWTIFFFFGTDFIVDGFSSFTVH
jgi:hypothetical protein